MWKSKKLGEISKIKYGKGLPVKEFKDSGYPVFGANGVIGYYNDYHYQDEMVLISCRGAASGSINFSPKNSFVTNNSLVLEFDEEKLSKRFIYYALKEVNKSRIITGSAQPQVTINNAQELELNIPPLPTQHRIVEKIEELFSELDHGVESLKKARIQLKTYRQAVLKDAFEGKLTKEWREQQTDLPTPKGLLEQIKAERNAHHERELAKWEEEVKQWEKEGKPGKKPRKPSKLKTASKIDESEVENLPILPNGWTWIRLGNLSNDIQIGPFGSLLHKSDYIENGIPVINPSNINNEKIVCDTSITISEEKFSELKKYALNQGDVILGRRGEMGRSALVTNKEKGWLCGTGSLFIKLNNCNAPLFITKYLRSKTFVDYLNRNARGTTMKNLNATILSDSPVPLLSKKEQNQIIQEIESRLSIVDQLEKTIEENLLKAEALRQSILKKAFNGELVEG